MGLKGCEGSGFRVSGLVLQQEPPTLLFGLLRDPDGKQHLVLKCCMFRVLGL